VSRIREQPKEKKEKAVEGGRNREKNRETKRGKETARHDEQST